jgi:hypothetical protein
VVNGRSDDSRGPNTVDDPAVAAITAKGRPVRTTSKHRSSSRMVRPPIRSAVWHGDAQPMKGAAAPRDAGAHTKRVGRRHSCLLFAGEAHVRHSWRSRGAGGARLPNGVGGTGILGRRRCRDLDRAGGERPLSVQSCDRRRGDRQRPLLRADRPTTQMDVCRDRGRKGEGCARDR